MICRLEDFRSATRLYDSFEHEALTQRAWRPSEARAFVRHVVREIDEMYRPGERFPLHPEDREEGECEALSGVYCGSAGTMWALTRLAERYGITLRHRYDIELERCEERYRTDPFETGAVVPSYFLGLTGILTARYALTNDASLLEPLLAAIRMNLGNPTREALWGSAGTALSALLVRERLRERPGLRIEIARFDDVIRAIQHELWSTWEQGDEDGGLLWQQRLYERRRRFVGAAHGAIGNLAPFLRAPELLWEEHRAALPARIAALLDRYAICENGAANWYTMGSPLGGNRVQWCHGSPGVITGLAALATSDERVEELLALGGEGIWRAGPVRKGPTLCHGTAGNGFAFLRLAERTGEARWTDRAQRFAAHAIGQVAAWRREFGMPATSLWTGDLGVALYVDAVLRADPAILTIDTM